MIQYETIEGIPEVSLLAELLEVHNLVFKTNFPTNGFLYEMENKKNVLINLAKIDGKIVGYKIGHEEKLGLFYSWLGGVAPDSRRQGIAQNLMNHQHQWLKEKKFQTIRTHTSNQFKEMLILNLKNGFDITGTNINSKGESRIILQKKI